MPTELSVEEIDEIVLAYGRSAGRVRAAGFDLVELHAGHGYLVGQFLSPITNRRGDLYGGGLEQCQRFARDVVRAMRRAVGDGFPITARLSSSEYQEGGITLEETIATARMLEAEGVAAIDVSAGNHHTMDIQVQPMYAPLAANAAAAGEVRRAVGIRCRSSARSPTRPLPSRCSSAGTPTSSGSGGHSSPTRTTRGKSSADRPSRSARASAATSASTGAWRFGARSGAR